MRENQGVREETGNFTLWKILGKNQGLLAEISGIKKIDK